MQNPKPAHEADRVREGVWRVSQLEKAHSKRYQIITEESDNTCRSVSEAVKVTTAIKIASVA
jgi:hypothetical protein